MARVYLAQARANRHHPNWHAILLSWAAQRRKQAAIRITQPKEQS